MGRIDNEALVKDRFPKDIKNHKINIKRGLDSGYGHWRCQKPGTWIMGFDIVVWPGSLCYTGDMGDFLFQQTDDMIAFMRTATRDIGYCAEKVVAGRDKIEEWSEQQFHRELKERLKEGKTQRVMRQGSFRDESVKDKIREIISDYENYSDPHDATRAMYESGLWDGCDPPSCKVYTVRFLWCVRAIQWFCENLQKIQEAANGTH